MKLIAAALYADHLDLNGDQANLKVLAKRARWYGIALEIIDVQKGQNLPAATDLIFIGHGSQAAWQEVSADLDSLYESIRQHMDNGGTLMAVASGYEMCVSKGLISGANHKQPRVSKFEIAELEGQKVLGYLNTESTLPVVQRQSGALLTMLHGPFFVKNPSIADEVLRRLLEAKGHTFEPAFVTEKAGQSADFIKAMVADAWQLESELARE